MMTIPGNTMGQVFRNLVERPELDDAERAAARKMADWLGELEATEAQMSEAMHAGRRDDWEVAADRLHGVHGRAPFRGNLMRPEGETRTGLRNACVGRIRFTIAPHTAGATMNVGIDRF